ncbi:MAG: hypothetical protein WD738_24110 [Pirellulales bacterium]
MHHRYVTASARVSEDNRAAGGMADVGISRVLEHFFDFFVRDAVLLAVLHVQ